MTLSTDKIKMIVLLKEEKIGVSIMRLELDSDEEYSLEQVVENGVEQKYDLLFAFTNEPSIFDLTEQIKSGSAISEMEGMSLLVVLNKEHL